MWCAEQIAKNEKKRKKSLIIFVVEHKKKTIKQQFRLHERSRSHSNTHSTAHHTHRYYTYCVHRNDDAKKRHHRIVRAKPFHTMEARASDSPNDMILKLPPIQRWIFPCHGDCCRHGSTILSSFWQTPLQRTSSIQHVIKWISWAFSAASAHNLRLHNSRMRSCNTYILYIFVQCIVHSLTNFQFGYSLWAIESNIEKCSSTHLKHQQQMLRHSSTLSKF